MCILASMTLTRLWRDVLSSSATTAASMVLAPELTLIAASTQLTSDWSDVRSNSATTEASSKPKLFTPEEE